jgi:hypothetical protein
MYHYRTVFLQRSVGAVGALFLAAAAVAGGCDRADDKVGADEGEIVPEDASTTFDLAAVCDQTLAVHAAVRPFDVADGSVRWKCGDVDGVTSFTKKGAIGFDRGQEYCEYMAVSKGRAIRSTAQAATGEGGSPALQCVFTGVYRDHLDPENDRDRRYNEARDAELAAALAAPVNLGAPFVDDLRQPFNPAVPELIDPLVLMRKFVNSRGAADTLIEDCSAAGPDLNDDRQAACYLASVEASDPAVKQQLRDLCRGADLRDEARWAKVEALGAKVAAEADPSFQRQRDVIGCMAAGRAKHGASTFRNSDPMICGRIFRAHEECGCTWSALPAELPGFLMTGWASDRLPVGCRHAEIDGQTFPHLVICDVPESEAADLPLQPEFSDDLQAFCNVRFGRDIAMRAPIRAVEQAGTCRRDTAFCAEFSPAPTPPAAP